MHDQNWVFGSGAGLDFSTDPPTPMSGFGMTSFEGCASVSDAQGNLLFYTNGASIWDAQHEVRVTGLPGDASSSQSCVIVPDPAHADRYYIFTTDGGSNVEPPFDHLGGVHLDLNSWTADPVWESHAPPPTRGLSPTERITAIPHANGRDYWVITVLQEGKDRQVPMGSIDEGPGLFRIFLVNADGVQHAGDTPMQRISHEIGYLKASSDGQMLGLANGGEVFFYAFDPVNATIDVAGERSVAIPTVPHEVTKTAYGIEFATGGRFAYFTTISRSEAPESSGHIFQVDLDHETLSPELVGSYTNPRGRRYAIGALQIGPDGVIYIAMDDEPLLGAILVPDAPGIACEVNFQQVKLLEGSRCLMGLPNMVHGEKA